MILRRVSGAYGGEKFWFSNSTSPSSLSNPRRSEGGHGRQSHGPIVMQEHVVTHGARRRSVAKLSGHTRDRKGCVTCRRRKKKCDGIEGRCDGCRRLNLYCEWEPERHVVAVTVPTSSTRQTQHNDHAVAGQFGAMIKAPDPLEFWVQTTENDVSSAIWNRRMSLRYYVQSFAAILSCNVENNGFLSGEW